MNRKRAVRGLETPNMGDEYPFGFLPCLDDNGNVAEPCLFLSFENPYRSPSCVEAYWQGRDSQRSQNS